jgi:hypothetical protein
MNDREKHFILIVIFTFLVTVGIVPSVFAGQQRAGEYQVKAAFLYNFINFIDWPSQSSLKSSPNITLCIIGDDPFGDALEDLRNEPVQGKKLAIRYRSYDDLRGCNILFLPASERHLTSRILKSIGKADVLTVSDSAESAQQGIVISFSIEQQKVRFAVNIGAAKRAGLRISAKLLKLATIVVSDEDKDSTE